MTRYLIAAFAVLVTGVVAEAYLTHVRDASAQIPLPCNNACRHRQYFKMCGGGGSGGTCRFYEEPTCARCFFTGVCVDNGDASWWNCRRKLNTRCTEVNDACTGRCGCGTTDPGLSTEATYFEEVGSWFDMPRYYCQLLDEYP